MLRLQELKSLIDGLYQEKREGRGDWADWLYENHVFLVADEAGKIADRFGAKKELAMAAAMLHDVADAVMSRFDPMHEQESLRIAKEFLQGAKFSEEEIEVIVDDAIKLHGCHNGDAPRSLEGKAMASADAIVHLTSDFYEYGASAMKGEKTRDDIRKWALPKIERDFNNKIAFDELREEVRPAYEKQKDFFQSEF